ncbi:MAG: transglycosylase SLT domain-containing protein [Gammaproteobacteria bacterium]|jgi:membrane-bound lytic murein transglycosylase MltF|nr:transglycosylase SLT domain-containing protein [Gammaproteobacteria bacterium]
MRFFLVFISLFLISKPVFGEVPKESLKYKRDLIRHSRIIWGLNAPVPLFAAQIHQESSWNHLAKSKYAEGLSQFTGSTAEWIIKIFPELEDANVYNPIWSIRAMLLYDTWLNERISSSGECNQWAMILSSYNGGLTWLNMDKEITKNNNKDPETWWNNVENYSSRANWAYQENRDYPKKIIFLHQPKYLNWGGKHICGDLSK